MSVQFLKYCKFEIFACIFVMWTLDHQCNKCCFKKKYAIISLVFTANLKYDYLPCIKNCIITLYLLFIKCYLKMVISLVDWCYFHNLAHAVCYVNWSYISNSLIFFYISDKWKKWFSRCMIMHVTVNKMYWDTQTFI